MLIHRRHAVFPAALAALLASLLAARACDLPAGLAVLRSDVIAQVNAQRRAHGLSALQDSGKLQTAAQDLACDNADRQTALHVLSDGTQLQGRLRTVGYRFSAASENVQMGAGAPAAAVAWWMGSPAHRTNILNPAISNIGVGVATQDGTLHWVITMGTPG